MALSGGHRHGTAQHLAVSKVSVLKSALLETGNLVSFMEATDQRLIRSRSFGVWKQ